MFESGKAKKRHSSLKKQGVKTGQCGIATRERYCAGRIMDKIDSPINDAEASKRFMSLVLPVQKKLYAYIICHVPNKNDSDDIFQETLVTLLSKFSEYQEGTDFLRWAITVAKFKILSYRRDNKRVRVLFNEADMDQIQTEAVGKIDSLEEESEYLKKCLKKLSEKQGELLQYRYGHGMTYRQIANKFNISMQSVYRAIARIHVSLLKCINLSLRFGGSHE